MPCLRTTLGKGFLSAVLLLACPMQGMGLTIDAEAWELVATTAVGQIYQRDFAGSSIPW